MSSRPIRPTIRGLADDVRPQGALADDLREGLSYWASGVAVLAVSDGADVDAITVTAFSAVSLDPPLVLVCVNEQSSTLTMLLQEGAFTVNILPEDGSRTAAMVAGRLPLGELSFARTGPPVLEGSLVSFVCTVWEAYPGGDHRIVVGRVERVEFGRDARPLLYFRRDYRALGNGRPR